MKKIDISVDQVKQIIQDYLENKLSSNALHEKYKIPKKRILLILKENNIELRNSGRIYIGGVKESYKRYIKKEGVKERKISISKIWQEKNKEYRKQYIKEWRENNKERVKETKRIYEKKRKDSDPKYKLVANFRTAIYTVLKENNLKKYSSYFDTLGYSPEQLIEHLEKQFIDNMSWDNYGKWHVDHILPITSFEFETVDDNEFKKCWSLENLRPLWGPENISKSNKIL